jgi:hypothetical protein
MAEQQIQVNIDYLRQQRVHLCMPCYGGQLTESTFMSYIKWGNTCRQLGIDWTIETMTNESLISRARNTLVAKFLNTENSTHLVFIDADIGWEPWHLLLLINHDVDVIGGLYPMKSLPVRWVVNGVENGAVSDDGNVVEVSKTGTGFMVVKRHVFDKLQQHPAVVPFKNDIGLPQELDPHMRTYYDTDVREGRYYSEDWTFCENWRDLGGKVWVDKRVLLRHTGTYTFDYQTQQPLYEALKREIEANAVPPAPEPEIVADSTADLSHLPPERQSAKVLAKTKTVPKEEVSSTQDS